MLEEKSKEINRLSTVLEKYEAGMEPLPTMRNTDSKKTLGRDREDAIAVL